MNMILCKKWLLSGCLILLLHSVSGQGTPDTIKSACSVSFQGSYVGDVVSNFSGGIRRGTAYLGLANLKAAFNTETARWWKGGEFFVNIGNTHGGEPSADLVGDFQGISNIEADNLTFMYELWYRQNLGKFVVIVGLQDLNADFASSENGALFNNSSFGIHPSIADNIPSPIFPLTALGLNIKYKVLPSLEWGAAIFDGTPDQFESNPYNIHWKLSKTQGFLAVSEFRLNKSLIENRTGMYKLGLYYHQHADTVRSEQRNGGTYLVADQQVSEKMSLFSQIGVSPWKKNKNNYYCSLGLNYKGLFPKRSEDNCGVAVAYAGLHDNAVGSETVLELAYSVKLNEYMYVKPDLQYVVNPAGTDQKLPNALVGFVRFGVQF